MPGNRDGVQKIECVSSLSKVIQLRARIIFSTMQDECVRSTGGERREDDYEAYCYYYYYYCLLVYRNAVITLTACATLGTTSLGSTSMHLDACTSMSSIVY